MTALRGEAPAKINRELRVGTRREDGYHELLSRFASIDLCDTIEVEPADRLSLVLEGRPIQGMGENLVLTAARLLARELRIEPRAKMRLIKRIPVGAGLGGGSTDAACTLRLLSLLWKQEVADETLERIALELGSDVPYFLVGGEADVSGRGEHVAPRPDPEPAESVDLLLLLPPFPVSTRAAFARHEIRTGGRARLPERLDIETSGKFFGPNDLASAVLEIHIEMKAYLDSAAEVASEWAMTGSGSTVVLRGASEKAEGLLAQRHPEAGTIRTRTLPRGEYLVRTSSPGGSQWTSRK